MIFDKLAANYTRRIPDVCSGTKQLHFAVSAFVTHTPAHLPLELLFFSVCLSASGGSRRLSEAVIWHVSECVGANQTEGPL